jgi:hypothetical protein
MHRPLLLLLLSLASSTGCVIWQKPSGQVEPRVPGLHELVIFRPDVVERDVPAVDLREGDGGELFVEMPEIVHVHRYYYSGDREFQGPIIEGGATIVAAKHPKTGEMLYFPVMLPTGAPVIEHNKHGITYSFNDRRVSIHFSSWDCQKATVSHKAGRGWFRTSSEIKESLRGRAKESIENCATFQSLKEGAINIGKAMGGVKQVADQGAAKLLDGARQVGDVVPGVQQLRSLGERRGEFQQKTEIRRGLLDRELGETEFVPRQF